MSDEPSAWANLMLWIAVFSAFCAPLAIGSGIALVRWRLARSSMPGHGFEVIVVKAIEEMPGSGNIMLSKGMKFLLSKRFAWSAEGVAFGCLVSGNSEGFYIISDVLAAMWLVLGLVLVFASRTERSRLKRMGWPGRMV